MFHVTVVRYLDCFSVLHTNEPIDLVIWEKLNVCRSIWRKWVWRSAWWAMIHFTLFFLPGDQEKIWKRWIPSVPTRQTLFILGLVALSKICFRHMFIMNANSNCISVFWAALKYGYSLSWTYWSCLPTSLVVSVLVPLKAFHPCPTNRTDQSKAGSQVGTVSNATQGFSKDC